MEYCEQHQVIATDMAVIKNDLQYIKDRICSHITQGEEKGGFRDRLIILEQSVSELKKAEWTRVITAGAIGGLIGNISPDLIKGLLWLIGIR